MQEYMTVGDVAKELAVAGETVRWWNRTGRLPAIRTCSGMRLIERRDVEALRLARAQKARTRG